MYHLRSSFRALLAARRAGGCLVVPYPVSNPTPLPLTAEDTAAFKTGVTTKAEIIQKLGTPQLELPDLRLIAYEWAQVDWHVFLLFVGAGVGGGVAGGILDFDVPYTFFVAFDQEDRVLAFIFEKSGLLHGRLSPIQQALRDWAKRQGLAVPDLPSRFVALNVPPGQAVLYIYHAGGVSAPLSQAWVDGKLEAEFNKGMYVAIALPPGNHSVKVVALPDSDDLGKTVSLDVAPSMKYFLSFRTPWLWARGGGYVEINLQSEQEAMPVLSQMAPAR